MKRFILLAIFSFSILGCSPDQDLEEINYEFAPIISVDLPETLVHGEHYIFEVEYSRPSSCHAFEGFDITSEANEFNVAVVNAHFLENTNCTEEAILTEVSIDFYVDRNDFYIFKFWQGQNENGEPQFLTVEVPVEP